MPPVVLKFGGTSVASLSRWQAIAEQIRARLEAGEQPIVVCSAVAGVSDQLVALCEAAPRHEHEPLLDALEALHHHLADAMAVSRDVLADELAMVRRLATGAALLEELTDAVRARILARGELLSTRLGAAWLQQQGLDVRWVDARELLTSVAQPGARGWLQAHVEPGPRDDAKALLGEGAVLTQGFIARSPDGHTVLLGRGGSDTSAALLASRVDAVRCEIWTDVPGMFTADPRQVGAARLLRQLGYAEAQEIATMGAKVLHPRAIAPVRASRIELHVRCTQAPQMPGTVVGPASDEAAQVKAISSRKGIVMVTMETLGMWQEVGFLARAFAAFADEGLSIDSVSTSETSVTVTLDTGATEVDRAALQRVLNRLPPCSPSVREGCASVSLVGRGIRTILHKLASVLELFEEHRVHMVSQAASDLNLTVVVDEDQAPRLVQKLHALLFAHREADDVLGPTWEQLFAPAGTGGLPTPTSTVPWWEQRRDELLALAVGGPAYVYDEATLRSQARGLVGMHSVDHVLYAIKANPHPEVLRVLRDEGVGFETVSPGEIARVREHHRDAPILFTPNFAGRQEYVDAFATPGVAVTLDNLHPLEAWPDVFRGRDVFVRMDPGTGRGHHAKVRTAGHASKFGVPQEQLAQLVSLADAAGCRIVGLHAHSGSGVLDPTAWQELALLLGELADDLPSVTTLDLGGGLGVPTHPGQAPLDLSALDACLAEAKALRPHLQLQLEPGRFLVAEAGVLLCTVTQLKGKGSLRYVGVDAGMHTLIRPALYGSRHHVVNLSRLGEPPGPPVTVVGPICESGDVLARDRRLPEPREGDVLLFATAGAYGASMSSDYNLRPRAREVLISP